MVGGSAVLVSSRGVEKATSSKGDACMCCAFSSCLASRRYYYPYCRAESTYREKHKVTKSVHAVLSLLVAATLDDRADQQAAAAG
jgi:hypothetical protein